MTLCVWCRHRPAILGSYCGEGCKKGSQRGTARPVRLAGLGGAELRAELAAGPWRACLACGCYLERGERPVRVDARTCSERCKKAIQRGVPPLGLAEVYGRCSGCRGAVIWRFRPEPGQGVGAVECTTCGACSYGTVEAMPWEADEAIGDTALEALDDARLVPDDDVEGPDDGVVRPLLKWAGGKARLAQTIERAFDGVCRGRHVEPFLGSGALYLWRRAHGRTQDGAILADLNPRIIGLHVAVRDQVDDVLEELSRLPTDESWRDSFLRLRAAFNAGPHHGPAHAARFVWMNRACFNGLYRENRAGVFNVSIGQYPTLTMPSEAHFRQVSRLFAGAELRIGGFEETMAGARRGDHVYCDPPYVPLTPTAAFTSYSGQGFGLAEQRALVTAAQAAAARGAHVVLSNHDAPVVRVLYSPAAGFVVVDRPPVSRTISRSTDRRRPVYELVARLAPRRPASGASRRTATA